LYQKYHPDPSHDAVVQVASSVLMVLVLILVLPLVLVLMLVPDLDLWTAFFDLSINRNTLIGIFSFRNNLSKVGHTIINLPFHSVMMTTT
jgi:hypothetical protein